MNRNLLSQQLVCQDGSLSLEPCESANRELEDNQFLIDVKSVGLCRTDLYAIGGGIEGLKRFIPGHEFSGVVTKASDATDSQSGVNIGLGQRVVVNPVIACQQCDDCLRGDVHWCADTQFLGVDLDGALQTSIAVDATQIFPVTENLTMEEAAFAEPVAATLGMFQTAAFDLSDPQSRQGLLIGSGRIFELAKRVIAAKGFSNVLAFDPFRDPAPPSGKFDFVVETQLCPTVLREVIRCVKPRGTIIIKSRSNQPLGVIPRDWIPKQPSIQMVNYGKFAEAVELLESRRVIVTDLIGPIFSLDEFELAFKAARDSDAQKTFIRVSS